MDIKKREFLTAGLVAGGLAAAGTAIGKKALPPHRQDAALERRAAAVPADAKQPRSPPACSLPRSTSTTSRAVSTR